MDAAILELQYRPITTDFVRSIDRMSHNLPLEFTLGLDAKVIYLTHQDNDDDDYDVNIKANDVQYDDDKPIIDMDDTDGLTDVLNDFEDIRSSLNDEVDINFNDNDFNDINGENDSRNKYFNDHVEDLFSGKEMNNLHDLMENNGFNSKSICNTMNTEFNGKTVIKKTLDESNKITAAKKAINKEIVNKNLNVNLPDDINFTDVSINTNDLNDNSNLVDAFNNFILDHDYLDDKFLIETGEADTMKKHIVSKKAEEESLLREIIPKMTKKEKKLVIKEIENNVQMKRTKPKMKLPDALKNIKKHKKKLMKEDTKNDDSSNSILFTVKTDAHDTKEVTSDFVKFGDDFNFRVFVLTREEQLEELEKKREGVLYLGAPYKCVTCAKGFRSPVTYKNHMKIHDPSHGAFPCGVCQSRFSSAPRRRRHAATHRLKLCCTRCEFVARTREKAESHFEWHAGRRFPCEHCGETFGKVSTQLSHVRLRHPAACVACAACGEPFVGALGLRLHTKRVHASEPKSQELTEWYCFSCRLQFNNQQAFERHKVVSGCSPHSRSCAECGESFESDESLLQHRRLAHSETAVQCQMCDASFANVTSRETHFERVHLNVRGRKQDGAMRVKSAARANVEKRKVMCEICGNKYHSAAALSYHQRSHSGERPYPCSRCPKSFALAHSLQAHLRTHTGERPHRCSKCARAFRNANNLARHNKTVHLGQRQRSRCGVCRRWLASPSGLRRHQHKHHHQLPWPRNQLA